VRFDQEFVTAKDEIFHGKCALAASLTKGCFKKGMVKDMQCGVDSKVTHCHAGENEVNARGLALVALSKPCVPWFVCCLC
jgi:hypothetical protein